MGAERSLTLIYLVLGIVTGVLSNYWNMTISIAVGIVLYLASFFIIRQIATERKKFSWYVLNTLLTFVLVWLVTWIFLFNL